MKLDEKMRKAHMERVGEKKCNAKLMVSFNNILYNIDRMGNCCVNLVDTASNQVDLRRYLTDWNTPVEEEVKLEDNVIKETGKRKKEKKK